MFFRMVYKSGQIFLPFCHNTRVWQTDGQTEFSSLYRVCITCSAVKIWELRPPPTWITAYTYTWVSLQNGNDLVNRSSMVTEMRLRSWTVITLIDIAWCCHS